MTAAEGPEVIGPNRPLETRCQTPPLALKAKLDFGVR